MAARLSPLAVVAVAAAVSVRCAAAPPAPPAPPPSVQVVDVLQRDVPIYIESIGVTRGDAEIDVRARIEGVLQSVNFAEGRLVNKGDLLYTIDPREYEAALQQAKARLAQAEADLARTEQDVARLTPLVEQNAVPRQTLETAVAQTKAGHANVQAAQAGVVAAGLDVSYTRIVSPTDGIIGKTEVNEGNLVGRGQSTLLTQISRVDPIRLRVSISERQYLELARRRDEIGQPYQPGYPLVDSGRGRAGVAIATAQAEQAAVAYRNAILIAFREVADTLVTLQKVRERIAQRQVQVTAAREALRLSDLRYVGGVADYLEVLDTQRTLYLAETDLARSRQDELVASVQLYRALGGGWSDDELRRLMEAPADARN